MKRKLFTFTSVLSLLLFVVTAVLWARNTTRYEMVGVNSPTLSAKLVVKSYHGSFRVMFVNGPAGLTTRFYAYSRRGMTLDEQDYSFGFRLLGFAYATGDVGSGIAHPFLEVRCPCWAILVVLSVMPLHRVYSAFRRRTGLCPTCSYNLTGNTTGVCPECGTPIPPTAEANP